MKTNHNCNLLNPIDNYTQLSNELIDALARCSTISARQFQIVLAVIRKTIGWGKSTDWISRSQLAEMIGFQGAQNNLSRDLANLLDNGIIIKKGRSIGIQPDLELWITSNDKKSGIKGDTIEPSESIISDTKKVSSVIHTKDTIQNKSKDTHNTHKREKNLDCFALTKDHEEFAKHQNLFVNLDLEFQKFVLHQRSTGAKFACWDSAFKKWLLMCKPSRAAKAVQSKINQNHSDKITGRYSALNDATIAKIKRDFAQH